MAGRIRLRNLAGFNKELRNFGRKQVPEDHLRLQKTIAIDLLRRIIFRTPVDTGRARGNWQAGSKSNDDVVDQVGEASLLQGVKNIRAIARPFGPISLFNNVKYIKRLEGGSSQQAPSGMVKVSRAEVEAQFS